LIDASRATQHRHHGFPVAAPATDHGKTALAEPHTGNEGNDCMTVQFVLSEYLEGALEQADYDKLSDGTFSARIPACPGVVAFAPTLNECERELRSVLEDWVLLGLKLGYRLPVVRGIDLNKDLAHAPVEPL
jgi:predicted RNase H-like HicB family nuclease